MTKTNIIKTITKFMTVTLISAPLLTGCSEDKEKEHDVNYYLEHPSEREAKIKECFKDIAAAVNNQNCKNAEAASLKAMSKYKNMPQLKIK